MIQRFESKINNDVYLKIQDFMCLLFSRFNLDHRMIARNITRQR